MSSVHNPAPEVHDDTRINVAALLMDTIGATREVAYAFESFVLDDDLAARNVAGHVRFTRLEHSILASGRFTGVVTLECVRCLTEYDQSFVATFTEEFRQLVDVRTGVVITPEPGESLTGEEDDEEAEFVIEENHELDIGEALRQWILLSLPMRPDCGKNCPGPLLTQTDPESVGDSRFAGLADLLGNDDEEDEPNDAGNA